MHHRHPGDTGPARAAPRAALSLFLLLGACAGPRPDPGADAEAAWAVGLDHAITFRTEGGPVDEPAAGPSLTWADAVQRAVATSPEVQAALARVRIAMADADQARLLPNPVLSVVLRWGPGKPQIEASLAQDLVQAMQVRRRSSAADHRLRRSAAEAVTTALDVAVEVQERYAGAQSLDAIIPLLEARSGLLRRLSDTARARHEAGETTSAEVTVLEAQRVELEVEIAAAQLERREERLHLARLIGEPSSDADWELEPWTPPDAVMEPESRWIQAALAHRPEVQSATWELEALGDDQALSRLLPWEGAGLGLEAQRDDAWFAGPSVTTPIPLFDTGKARRARVTAEQIEARHQLTLARRKVVEEVRVAYDALSAGRANLDRIRHRLLPLQQQRRQASEDLYEVERDITPLLLAEHDLRAAQARAIDGERQITLALIRLRRAVGGPGAARTLKDPPPAAAQVSAITEPASPHPEASPALAADSPRRTR